MAFTCEHAVEITGLTVRRGKRTVLNNLSLTIPRGVITGLLGPSGCGKTTLMRSIVGTQIVSSGTVTVLGSPAGSAPLRRTVGYVTQAPSVYRDLTVRENVQYFGSLYGRRRADVASAIASVGLADHASSRAGELSGGQLGRVSLASALVAEPQLIVLDEPTVGLDPVLRSELWSRFADIAASGTTVLVSSHVMEEAEHCSRLVLMRDGTVLAHSSPDALLARTNETTLDRAFLSLIRSTEETS
ncbi:MULTISPECIES: ABC transporter ATP-binding protein [unclassified Rhodococcus (in: high G+C Gram-positive bacteria)]|uniref:ABC transporter ATP-binding protein n=2 Tax=Rhodococcus TaxID=1827 RepID=UPI000B9C60E3|nr:MULTISPECIES: ABC transporter ATP-binding protein [unclassified Rhodococcus (in: high G+C Gram-positive bacteria)]OZE35268.1 multidrug ABC transporter ATP-binding protein [Rhodococcus sp. 05-2254-4]OZE47697.1 multidrug ABC transporter ATP-binding protein [Rhodococcus sp. 05-2254-3]OZE48908.1 multidrug ABC transporter ATP-binding protein [Rhodococcus sp. 05-2254-2]